MAFDQDPSCSKTVINHNQSKNVENNTLADKSRFLPKPVQWTVTVLPRLGVAPLPIRDHQLESKGSIEMSKQQPFSHRTNRTKLTFLKNSFLKSHSQLLATRQLRRDGSLS
jgi:hypothetical protein